MNVRRCGNRAGPAALVLLAVTVVAFLPMLGNGFLEYDDHTYITQNPRVLSGLTLEGVHWAFTSVHASNWHPLTWVAHMSNVSLFGLDARGHHLVSLLLHLGSTLLLFLVLARMTGRRRPAFFTAALFALHPLHVESVAWAAELKDVLSTFFWMLTMAAYLAYVRKPGALRNLALTASFALGLLSKPMLVTLPFVLLLLDFWPLGRLRLPLLFEGSRAGTVPPLSRLFFEKVPLFILAIASSGATYFAQASGGATRSWDYYPFFMRLNNALASYLAYLGKLVWPARLAVFYPHSREALPAWKGAAAFLLLAAVTVLLVRASRRRPYLGVGWLWYLGTLFPVIGLVQVGGQAMADRYTYVPLIGVFIILCWAAGDLAAGSARMRVLAAASGWLVLLSLVSLTRVQVGHWRDTITLFEHAVKVTRDNWQAHLNLGMALSRAGRKAEMQHHYAEVFRIKPDFVRGHDRQGMALSEKLRNAAGGAPRLPEGVTNEAMELYRRGFALMEQGRLDEAAGELRKSLELSPGFTEAGFLLGNILSRKGAKDEALGHYRELVRRAPDHVGVRINLAAELIRKGETGEAETHLREAVRLNPRSVEGHNNLGYLLSLRGRDREAVEEYLTVLEYQPENVTAMVNLADALLKTGKEEEAAARYREALRLDPSRERVRRKLQDLAR